MLKKLALLITLFASDVLAQAPTVNKVSPYTVLQVSGNGQSLRLDTRTGQIWQLLYLHTGLLGLNANAVILLPSTSFSQVAINPSPLADGTAPGRFTLNPVGNTAMVGVVMLVDQVGGGVWFLLPPARLGEPYTFAQFPDPS
jgi:hypothetical protein